MLRNLYGFLAAPALPGAGSGCALSSTAMSFFAVLFALLIEQLKPLPRDNWVHDTLVSWVRWTGRNFDAGRKAPCLGGVVRVGAGARVLAWGVYLLLAHYSLLLALAFDVAVLYLTLGFRQFSHYFTDIRDALDRGDENEARRLLAEWRHLDASELPRTEVLRHVIEHALLAAHRHVFGVFFWFVRAVGTGPGAAGAVLYRMAEFAAATGATASARWTRPPTSACWRSRSGLFAWIDHVPARLTAFGFAVVGNFEEAIGQLAA
jgi:adenosylcobinamide-phosphate synthase